MKPEVYVLDSMPSFESPPKGELRIIIASKSESGLTERTVVLCFDGTGSKPTIDYTKLEKSTPQPPTRCKLPIP